MYAIHAPAKVNLYLHVGPVRSDGRHPLDSLVVFADSRAADRIEFTPGGEDLSLTAVFENGVVGELGAVDDNLIMRAARLLGTVSGKPIRGKLHLRKRLPIAAGIGGGSSDAAATLLLLNAVLELGFSRDELQDMSIPLGGDVPACVAGKPVLMRGDGDRIETLKSSLPNLPSLLVSPLLPCPTGPVFKAFDETDDQEGFREIEPPSDQNVGSITARLRSDYRNDLQAPAIRLEPGIETVLKALNGMPGVNFSAMSGSGATCFAVFETETNARFAEREIDSAHASWWIYTSVLGEAGFDPEGFSI